MYIYSIVRCLTFRRLTDWLFETATGDILWRQVHDGLRKPVEFDKSFSSIQVSKKSKQDQVRKHSPLNKLTCKAMLSTYMC